MAPPDVNIEKQKRRHAGPLIGMAAVVAFGVIGLFWWIGHATQGPEETDAVEEAPAPADAQ
jgi:hypothetical protein